MLPRKASAGPHSKREAARLIRPQKHPDMTLDLDIEQKLRMAGLDHLIRRVRELDRAVDAVAMSMLDRLIAAKAAGHRRSVFMDSPVAPHYDTLGLSLNASLEETRSRYHRLAMKYHPDRGGDTRKMQAITEAYRAIVAYQTPP